MAPRDHELEFEAYARTYVLTRARPNFGLWPHRAAQLLFERASQDRQLLRRLAAWAHDHGQVWTLGDEQQIVAELVRAVAAGMIDVHEADSPPPPPNRPPSGYRSSGLEPKPPPPMPENEIADELRSLMITHCPASFDPQRETLRVSYLLRDLHGRPVELVVRSEAKPEPALHRRMLNTPETVDGPGTLEWNGKVDATGEWVAFGESPLVVELVHDATFRDRATTTLSGPQT